MKIDLAWHASKLDFEFMVESKDVLEIVRKGAPVLEQRLTGQGVDVGTFSWAIATPPEPPPPTEQQPTSQPERLGELDMRA